MSVRRRIVVTGATGLIGSALCSRLTALGYEVTALRSRHNGLGGMNHLTGRIDNEAIEGAYGVVHLAGEPIAQRWTSLSKHKMLSSRHDSTILLARTLAKLKHKPSVLISMSGINRYGLHRTETLDESSSVSAEGFLPKVTEAWEKATKPATEAGIRTVLLRTSLVLSAQGGGLKKMLPAFRFGFGGPIGGGRQHLSWIALPDLVELIVWTLENPTISGPVNAVAPQTVTQAEFARSLGGVLGRPSFLPLPAWVVSLLFGQMGRETLLSDLAVRPAVALAGGFHFSTPDLDSALRQALRE